MGLLETIIEFRRYRDAKGLYDTNRTDLQRTPMLQLVKAIDFELAQEATGAH